VTPQEFKDFCAIEVIKTFLQKLPGVGLPGNQYNDFSQQELIRKLAQDSWKMADAMAQERNNHITQT
jgi:hypothetical protein